MRGSLGIFFLPDARSALHAEQVTDEARRKTFNKMRSETRSEQGAGVDDFAVIGHATRPDPLNKNAGKVHGSARD